MVNLEYNLIELHQKWVVLVQSKDEGGTNKEEIESKRNNNFRELINLKSKLVIIIKIRSEIQFYQRENEEIKEWI